MVRAARLIVAVVLGCAPEAAAAPTAASEAAPEVPAEGEPALEWDRISCDGLEAPSVGPREITIAVPNVEPPPDGFRVIVAMDGEWALGGVLGVLPAVQALVERDLIEPVVIVAVPAGRNRRRELTPPGVHAFGDYLADVVLPAAEERVRLRTDAAGTTILGYSFGGLAAVHVGLDHPDRFGAVVAMSPSLWHRRGRAIEEVREHEGALPTRWWVDVGTLEGRRHQVVPYMVRDARRLRGVLIERGFELGVALGYDEAPGRRHAMNEAGRRMENALGFALTTRDEAPPVQSIELFLFRRLLPRRAGTTFVVRAMSPDGLSLAIPVEEVRLTSHDTNVVQIGDSARLRTHLSGRAHLTVRYAGRSASADLIVH